MQWQRRARRGGAATVGGQPVARPARAQPAWSTTCARVLAEHGMAAGQLQLEMTESLAAQDERVQATLRELKALGVQAGARRLRHRLFVAGLPAPAAGRHRQDRPQFVSHAETSRIPPRADRGDDPRGPHAGHDDGGRRHRDRRPGRADAAAGLRPRPGLPVQPAAAGRATTSPGSGHTRHRQRREAFAASRRACVAAPRAGPPTGIPRAVPSPVRTGLQLVALDPALRRTPLPAPRGR